ncbi:aspartate ammonia-lyase, putative [Entamoeba nuttalli P19]|uniref:fumarate hydratase n=1 Tax=Entamoeba nuttalli (strain P19) TaxID=1076696 RepID=K2HAH7_ENTNP|nr:aspartate ammonia-lyase, putative [Entamoeba nuttalli P19]EKE39604.1 aspartate ammonia-lyase, putative [Entamoeba nuttalli P19]|eukprot:XP_008858061.1 aspartate ammonia-lyase, putative [Entamoeba nuttalli P19]
MEYRLEKDSLGEVQVPKDAYYGAQTMRATKNFPITHHKVDPDFIHAFGYVKEATAYANCVDGILDKEKADYIMKAARELAEGKFDESVVVDPIQGGAGTSLNMNCNEIIANRALELMGQSRYHPDIISPNTHVNMSQSTNDAFPTAFHIAGLWKIDRLIAEMKLCYEEIEKKAVEFNDYLKMGRTHLQDAVPIRFSQELRAYNCIIKRGWERLERSKAAFEGINMGATAVGTGLNAEPKFIEAVTEKLAEISKTNVKNVPDLVDGTQNSDCYLEVHAAVSIIACCMSKVANDLRLMTSGPRCGLGEILLPPRQPGSSIMPGKVNPVIAEVMNQTCFQVIGNNTTIMWAASAGQFELNVMEPVMFYDLLSSLEIMKNAFFTFRTNLVHDLKANKERMQWFVDNSVGVITALNPHVGYEVAAATAKEAIASGRPVRDIILEKGVLTKEQLDIILRPDEMTTPGIAGAELLHNKK